MDELPESATLPKGLTFERHVIANAGGLARRRSVAFEVFRAFGASFHYGLLGGDFEGTGSSDFEYAVADEDPNPSIVLPESLAGTLDQVLVGGGDEFAAAIVAGVEELDPRTLPAGMLTFTCMAHGEVGSAPAVFSSLARAIIRMMTRAEDDTSFDDAMRLLAA
jgi:hypothetical protein